MQRVMNYKSYDSLQLSKQVQFSYISKFSLSNIGKRAAFATHNPNYYKTNQEKWVRTVLGYGKSPNT